jgi:hypothetical protein
MRKSEDNVEVRQPEQLSFAGIQPSLTGLRLALRAVAIAARVEGDGRVTAVRTAIEMAAQRRRAAAPYGAQYFQVLVTKPGTVLFYKAITVRAE